MEIKYMNNISDLSEEVSDLIVDAIIKKPDLLLCAATGNTPTATYKRMAEKLKGEQIQQLKIIKLDEWGGVPMNHSQTCEQYLMQYIIKPLQISAECYIGFNSNTENPIEEVQRVQVELDKCGRIDVCVLGLGTNGHIAFNEPSDNLQPHCHIARLSEKTMQHSMASQMEQKPLYGLTLGMTDILQSELIIMLIGGHNKKGITKAFLSKNITTQIPASFLWLHPNVHCFIDNQVCK